MKRRSGYLEVIAGPMYCGKTEELIRQVKRATIGKKRIKVFKHSIDTRYGFDKKLFSHAGLSFDSEMVGDAEKILAMIDGKTEIIAIDEAQWFGETLVSVIEKLMNHGKKVIVAGLSLTFDRKPFVPVPTLMAMADKVIKLSAICSVCGEEAVYHKRITKGKTVDSLLSDPSLVGKTTHYEARCRRCFHKK